MSSSRRDIENEIRRLIIAEGEPEIRRGLRDFGRELKAEAERLSPYDETAEPPHFKDLWAFRLRSRRGRLPSGRLSNSDRLAHIVEQGSGQEFGDRPQGGSSPPAFVLARLAWRHGGTVDEPGDDE